jgi:predicted nucleotidyltransferase
MSAFDTSILDQALAEEQEQRERERKALLKRTRQALAILAPQFGIEHAYLFGSLLQPNRFRTDSDIDIAVEQIAPEHLGRAISVLMTMLGREVDLVDLTRCPFAERIRRDGLLWTKRPTSS